MKKVSIFLLVVISIITLQNCSKDSPTVQQPDITSDWIDNTANPILESSGSDKDDLGVFHPTVIKYNDIYKMWFTGLSDNAVGYIYLATSVDGLTWRRARSTPVMSPGEAGTWDSQRVISGPVIVEDGIYRMYYTGWSNYSEKWEIGLAISLDGVSWAKNPQPVYSGTEDWEFRVIASSVIRVGTKYYLYYSGQEEDSEQWRQCVAISSDGMIWEAYSGNPILPVEYNWEFDNTFYGSTIYDNSNYTMVYSAGNPERQGFGLAYSVDALNWEKEETNPIVALHNVDTDLVQITRPFFIKTNNEYRIYYTGKDYDGKLVICLTAKAF